MSLRADQILYQCRRFRVVARDYLDACGSRHTREVICHPGSVVLLPVFDDARICLIRNHRAAVRETLIELPAGTLEPGEPPAVCAARELTEETGLVAGRLESLTAFYAAPGILDERMSLFSATQLTWQQPRREPGELIENLVVTWQEAMAMVADGTICDAKTIIGLLLGHQRLRPSLP